MDWCLYNKGLRHERVKWNHLIRILLIFKACVRYFYQIFIFSPNDSPSKTMKSAFYFVKKAPFVLGIIKFLYFRPSIFFSPSAIALEDDRR